MEKGALINLSMAGIQYQLSRGLFTLCRSDETRRIFSVRIAL